MESILQSNIVALHVLFIQFPVCVSRYCVAFAKHLTNITVIFASDLNYAVVTCA